MTDDLYRALLALSAVGYLAEARRLLPRSTPRVLVVVAEAMHLEDVGRGIAPPATWQIPWLSARAVRLPDARAAGDAS